MWFPGGKPMKLTLNTELKHARHNDRLKIICTIVCVKNNETYCRYCYNFVNVFSIAIFVGRGMESMLLYISQ